MQKDFDTWNSIKKGLESSEVVAALIPQEGEVWVCSLGENVGFEQSGRGDNFSRPVLIVKKFNNKMFWAVPLSSKQKTFDFYFNFIDPGGSHVAAILAQMRLVSVKRIERVLYKMPRHDFIEIRNTLASWLQSKSRTRRDFSAPSNEGTL